MNYNMNLNVRVEDVYQVAVNTIHSLWPIYAGYFGIMFATLVIGGIAVTLWKFYKGED